MRAKPFTYARMLAVCTGFWPTPLVQADSFVNWEHPQVHPLDLSPDGERLLVVNTADARLEILDLTGAWPVLSGSVSVGLDPVSVRARNNHQAWVVNHVSDSISVVDLDTLNVTATLLTADEPTDVVFAGTPVRAYVSCSQANLIQVFDPAQPFSPPVEIAIDAEEPRALAVSPDGLTVYAAIFESGNGSTVLSGSDDRRITLENAVSDPRGPWGGANPAPNAGDVFNPPLNPDLPTPPQVSLIVKKDAGGAWRDDLQGDWTEIVSGALADVSDRPRGWDLPDRDIAAIDTATHQVQYFTGLMNICMALAVNPATGKVAVVGTDATNEVRYEPVVNGRFLRVNVGLVSPEDASTNIADLNPHLDYATSTIPQSERNLSLGDPRSVVWNAAGTRGYVAGMGSNNVITINATGHRTGPGPIPVGQGPTGLALDEPRNRLYVLNRFEATISIVDALEPLEYGRVAFFDPTPEAIKRGRPHLYDTHQTSGLGHLSCASCHVDARTDRLGWDLGDPAGEMRPFNQNCFAGILDGPLGNGPCDDWHPMKGPMTTQTLQDIIGLEPLHWRGDRDGIEDFNGAFQSLMGDDESLTPEEMQEFEDFLATIAFPPNPFRNLDNSLPTALPLPGHVSVGRFTPPGTPMPPGNAVRALDAYRNDKLDRPAQCVSCHTLPTGAGTNLTLEGGTFDPFPIGPNGELHLALRPVGLSNIKIPQLRSVYDKIGADRQATTSRAGFGITHDGTMDSLVRFFSARTFVFETEQGIADMIAFMLAFSGSDLPTGFPNRPLELLGPPGRDTHAAVGAQVTLNADNANDPAAIARWDALLNVVDSGRVGLVAKGGGPAAERGFRYAGAGQFQSDRAAEQLSAAALRASVTAVSAVTLTVVPEGAQTRIGIDRDEDGHFDRDERDACSNPAAASSTPLNVQITGDADHDGDLDLADFAGMADCLTGPTAAAGQSCRCSFDISQDAKVGLNDFALFQAAYVGP